MQGASGDRGIGLVAVGFSPAARLEPIVRHLGWRGMVLSDPGRVLYRALGVGRASWRHVYTPGTLAIYGRALLRGERLKKPEEDTRQLGADAVLVDGAVRAIWRPRSPEDRPTGKSVMAEAAAWQCPATR